MTEAWLHKMPRADIAPLTAAWYVVVTQPRHHPDGTITYVLTPPRKSDGSVGWAIFGISCILALGVIFSYPLWRS